MRRVRGLLAACLIMTACAGTTLAAVLDPAMLTAEVIQSDDLSEIRKVYELDPSTDPGTLPRESFEQNGYRYECADILRSVIMGTVGRQLTEAVQVESAKNDMDTVLSLLPPALASETEDGYSGILYLDVSTIRAEVSGYGYTTTPIAATRRYPNLPDADMQFIPKTIEDSGRMLAFSSIVWVADSISNPDDYELGERYTAVVNYTETKTSSYVKGYLVTATYQGEVSKPCASAIRYTVVFYGTPIPVAEEPPPDKPQVPTAAIVFLGALIAVIILFILMNKRRVRNENQNNRRELGAAPADDLFGDGD